MQQARPPLAHWYEARLAPGLCGLGAALTILLLVTIL